MQRLPSTFVCAGDGRIAPRDTLMVEPRLLLQSPQTFETLGIRKLDDEDWQGAAEQFRKGSRSLPTLCAAPSSGHRAQHDGRRRGSQNRIETAIAKGPEYFPAQFSLV